MPGKVEYYAGMAIRPKNQRIMDSGLFADYLCRGSLESALKLRIWIPDYIFENRRIPDSKLRIMIAIPGIM